MKVSVIIPVFNAEIFIEKAVLSALEQKQTKEIILIEDGSKDNSLNKCTELEKKYPKVKLYTHNKNQNKGASASRNLGIEKSNFSFIAFLDADDFYLPGFFDKAENIFSSFPNSEGIFGSIGAYYYDEDSKVKHLQRNERDITGLTFDFDPDFDNLFEILLKPRTGHLHLDGIIIKKSVINKIGNFNPVLLHTQDTDFIWRLSLFCKLYPIDKNKLVAIRGVHSKNRVFDKDTQSHYGNLLFKIWIKNIYKFKIPSSSAKLILQRFLAQNPIVKKYNEFFIIRLLLKTALSFFIFFKHPYIFYILMKGVFEHKN